MTRPVPCPHPANPPTPCPKPTPWPPTGLAPPTHAYPLPQPCTPITNTLPPTSRLHDFPLPLPNHPRPGPQPILPPHPYLSFQQQSFFQVVDVIKLCISKAPQALGTSFQGQPYRMSLHTVTTLTPDSTPLAYHFNALLTSSSQRVEQYLFRSIHMIGCPGIQCMEAGLATGSCQSRQQWMPWEHWAACFGQTWTSRLDVTHLANVC